MTSRRRTTRVQLVLVVSTVIGCPRRARAETSVPSFVYRGGRGGRKIAAQQAESTPTLRLGKQRGQRPLNRRDQLSRNGGAGKPQFPTISSPTDGRSPRAPIVPPIRPPALAHLGSELEGETPLNYRSPHSGNPWTVGAVFRLTPGLIPPSPSPLTLRPTHAAATDEAARPAPGNFRAESEGEVATGSDGLGSATQGRQRSQLVPPTSLHSATRHRTSPARTPLLNNSSPGPASAEPEVRSQVTVSDRGKGAVMARVLRLRR